MAAPNKGRHSRSMLSIALIVLVLHAALAQEEIDCDKLVPAPTHPFKVVWNSPDNCERSGHHLNLSDYGFTFNKHRSFLGEEIETLYQTGRWPFYRGDTPVNGGLPQLFVDNNYNATYEAISQHKVADFQGLGVLDFESWRPVYITNFGSLAVYKTKSKELVQQRHPEYTAAMVESTATKEWDAAARRVMSRKLAIAQELMPGGHWGYYHYPRSYGGTSSPAQNNQISWLWRQATGLYPGIYLIHPDQPQHEKMARVHKEVEEAVRIQHLFSPPNTPIYPYSNPQQGPDIFFDADHLSATLGLPADMGASGVVLWGSSALYRPHGECQRLQTHMKTVLGPFVRNLTTFMYDCSEALCGGHGRCIHNDKNTLHSTHETHRLSEACTSRDSKFRDYHCRCYSFWSGDCCDTHTPPHCKQHPTQQQQQHPGNGTAASSSHGPDQNVTRSHGNTHPTDVPGSQGKGDTLVG